MKLLSPLAHPAGADSPTVGLRDWLAGARPVAGTAAACSLLLAVCSWFVIHDGAFGRGHGTGGPTSVPLRATPLGETEPNRATGARTHSAHARSGGAGQARPGHTISRAAPNPGSRLGSPDSAAPSPTAGTSASGATPQPQPPVAAPSATVPSVTTPTVTTPTVTTPVATVPGVTVPSVTTPSVTVPSVTVPSVTTPSAATPTTALGLP